MVANLDLHSVNAVLILTSDDRTRLLAKYYTPPHSQRPSLYPTVKEQQAFERGLLEKTAKQSGDILLYDSQVVVYKSEGDVMLYVVGDGDQNEILLFSVVLAIRDSLAILLKQSIDRRTIVENYDLCSLAIDEIVDDGIILETDPVAVASRVTKPPTQEMPNLKNMDLSEQTLLSVWEMGKSKLAERMRQGL